MRALAILGPGRVGRSLQAAAGDAGIAAELIGRDLAATKIDLAGASVILAVPDREIEAACAGLVAFTAAHAAPLARVGHTSGATGLEALAAASQAGIPTFSLHPLQTVPDGSADLSGAACAVTASDPENAEWAAGLARSLGMSPFALADADRAAYHAAASIASNFLISLEESAAALLERIGLEDARAHLAPLVTRTTENWVARGGAALTGPIARGDEGTVEAHRDALDRRAPELLELYEALVRRTRALARAEAAS